MANLEVVPDLVRRMDIVLTSNVSKKPGAFDFPKTAREVTGKLRNDIDLAVANLNNGTITAAQFDNMSQQITDEFFDRVATDGEKYNINPVVMNRVMGEAPDPSAPVGGTMSDEAVQLTQATAVGGDEPAVAAAVEEKIAEATQDRAEAVAAAGGRQRFNNATAGQLLERVATDLEDNSGNAEALANMAVRLAEAHGDLKGPKNPVKTALGRLRAKIVQRLFAVVPRAFAIEDMPREIPRLPSNKVGKMTRVQYFQGGTPAGIAKFGRTARTATAQQLATRAQYGYTGAGSYGRPTRHVQRPMEQYTTMGSGYNGQGGYLGALGGSLLGGLVGGRTGARVGGALGDIAGDLVGAGARAYFGGGAYEDGNGAVNRRRPRADDHMLTPGEEQQLMAEVAAMRQRGTMASDLLGDPDIDGDGKPDQTIGGGRRIMNNLVNPHSRYSRKPARITSLDTEEDTVVIEHSEFLGDLTATSRDFTNLAIIEMNPGLKKSFPALSAWAQLYERWDAKQFVFSTRSLAGNLTQSGGSIQISPVSNPAAPLLSSKREIADHTGAISGGVLDMLEAGIECQEGKTPIDKMLFIRTGPVGDGASLHTYDKGFVQVSCTGCTPNETIAELWAHYRVALSGFRGSDLQALSIGEGVQHSAQFANVANLRQAYNGFFGQRASVVDNSNVPVWTQYPLPNWVPTTQNGLLTPPGRYWRDVNDDPSLDTSKQIASWCQSPNIKEQFIYGGGTGTTSTVRLRFQAVPGGKYLIDVTHKQLLAPQDGVLPVADNANQNAGQAYVNVISGPMVTDTSLKSTVRQFVEFAPQSGNFGRSFYMSVSLNTVGGSGGLCVVELIINPDDMPTNWYAGGFDWSFIRLV